MSWALCCAICGIYQTQRENLKIKQKGNPPNLKRMLRLERILNLKELKLIPQKPTSIRRVLLFLLNKELE